jgi:DNA-binding winged helix-turn-helix (wHTH) protein
MAHPTNRVVSVTVGMTCLTRLMLSFGSSDIFVAYIKRRSLSQMVCGCLLCMLGYRETVICNADIVFHVFSNRSVSQTNQEEIA